MTRKSDVCDVFLSASPLDAGVAEVVRRSFEARGLRVFATHGQEFGGPSEDAVRSAMAESRAFVAILSRASMNAAALGLEIGAAWAWGKSVYLLLEGISPRDVPGWLSQPRYRAVPASEFSRVIDEIERSIEPLSEDQERRLGELYASAGVPTDHLANRPATLESLTGRFNDRGGTNLSPERILQELIRLRKRKRLPKLIRKIG